MTHLAYAAGLLIAITCLVLVDYRYKLAYFIEPWRTAIVLLITIVFMSLWDAAGIIGQIFYNGQSRFATGLELAPNYPVEEVFFLLLLSYSSLLLYRFWEQRRG